MHGSMMVVEDFARSLVEGFVIVSTSKIDLAKGVV